MMSVCYAIQLILLKLCVKDQEAHDSSVFHMHDSWVKKKHIFSCVQLKFPTPVHTLSTSHEYMKIQTN